MNAPNQPKLFWTNVTIFAFICIYSLMYPLMNDDLTRSNPQALISHSIFAHLYQDYFSLTGRMSAQFMVYVFFNSPVYNAFSVPLIAILTASSFLVLLRLAYSLILREQPSDQKINLYMLLVILLIYYLVKVYSLTELFGFKTVAIQYLWVTALSGAILLHYCPVGQPFPRLPPAPISRLVGFFLLGIFLGNFNEIITANVLLYLGFKLLNKHPSQRMLSFGLGNFFGFIVLILSPGSYARKINILTNKNMLNIHYSIFEKIHILISKYYQVHFKVECSYIALGLLVLAAFFIFLNEKAAIYKEQFFYFLKLIAFFWLSLLMLSPVAYYYDGWIGGRVTFIPDMFLFYITVGLLVLNFRLISKPNIRSTCIKLPWFFLFGALFFYFALFLYGCYPQYRYNQDMIKTIQHTPNAAAVDFVFPGFCREDQFPLGKWQIANPLSVDAAAWNNQAFATYYHARSVHELACH